MNGLQHNRAFVLQLRCEADIAADRVAGRVEHVASGRATRFDSLDELLEFLDQVLKAQVNQQIDEKPYRESLIAETAK